MERRLVIAGLGGQGVVFVTRLLTRAAVDLGHPVMASETHGMSQRGGSVVSHLKFGGSDAPLIQRGTAHALIALEPSEAVRNLPFVRRGGLVIVNADAATAPGGMYPVLTEHLERLRIRVFVYPAAGVASDMGMPAVANTALVGFAVAHPEIGLPLAAVRATLAALVPRSLELNQRALDAGHSAGLTTFGSQGTPEPADVSGGRA